MANKSKDNAGLEPLKNALLQQIQQKTGTGHQSENWNALMSHLDHLHFPGPGNEEWKYSPFQPPKGLSFSLGSSALKSAGILPTSSQLEAWKLIFWDGVFQPALSEIPAEKGFHLSPVQETTDWQSPYESGIFSALNVSTATESGISIRIDAGVVISKPILVEYHFSQTESGLWAQPRLQVWLEKNAQASFAEKWFFPETSGIVVNGVVEIHQEAGAQLRWTNLETGVAHISQIHQTRVWLEESAFFQHLQIALGEGFIRNNLEIKVAGSLADAHMYGLTLGNQKLHVDNHTFVNHKEENTTSNQLYKTIMAGKSTAVFNGKILVDQKAQKTNAYQSSKNLLITADAKVFAKPQLEIFADDVKCSHGATIGQLDEEPVFYLRSRGLDESAARKLLVLAFAGEILDKEANETLRQEWHNVVDVALENIQFN